MNAVSLRNLTKSYGDHTVLPGLDLEIPAGELFALLGPNGSGKSTLFRILTTLSKPDSGEVLVGGFDVVKQSADVRCAIGVVFQSPSLDKKLTVRENLAYGGALYGLHGKELRTRSEALLEALRLGEKRDALVETLSGGQQRRTEIAKCLLTRPSILLLDEPSTGLDPAARRDLWTLIRTLRSERPMTVVFTSHLMDESADADRVGILNAGRLAAVGSPAALLEEIGPEILRIETSDAPCVADLLREAGAGMHRTLEGEIRISTTDAHLLAREITVKAGPAILSSTISRPTLEDVFLFQTGCRLNE